MALNSASHFWLVVVDANGEFLSKCSLRIGERVPDGKRSHEPGEIVSGANSRQIGERHEGFALNMAEANISNIKPCKEDFQQLVMFLNKQKNTYHSTNKRLCWNWTNNA